MDSVRTAKRLGAERAMIIYRRSEEDVYKRQVLFICVAFSANAQLLWKVSGNGLNQPSYIIGTHHLAPFSIMDLSLIHISMESAYNEREKTKSGNYVDE